MAHLLIVRVTPRQRVAVWERALTRRARSFVSSFFNYGEILLMNQLRARFISSLKKYLLSKNTQKLLGIFLTVGTWATSTNFVTAQTDNVPEELAEIIEEMQEAANEQDIDEVMEYYSPDFTNEDGLTADYVETALEKMWSDYPQLTYETTIDSWEEQGDELVAETTTQITGSRDDGGRMIRLESELKSRQYFSDRQLVRQEILAEQTKISTGDNPPEVKVNLPETVKVGEQYNFDTIVTEPLEGGVLLGAALEERTGSDRYLAPSTLELEPLSSGGIYKVVTAPRLEDNHWLSSIIVRGDGITMVTQRVRIEE